MIGNLMILGDSYSTFKGYIVREDAYYYYPEEAREGDDKVRSMQLDETWWRRFVARTGAKLVRNDSWSGSTICYTGYLGDCSETSSFIYRYRCLLKEGFFEKNAVDTVIVFGGTNDSWCPAELGEMKIAGQTEEDLKTALPAISHIMSSMKNDLKGVRIVYIANCDIDTEIIECMKSEGERLGIEVVELSGIDKEAGHPTPLGMEQICNQVLSALGEG